LREQTSGPRPARTRQSKAKQSKAKQGRSKNQQEKHKIRGVRAKRQERAHRLNGSRSFSQRSCRAPQSRIQPTISRGWAFFDRFEHRSTESFEKQKSKTGSLLRTAGVCFVGLRSRPAASRGALRRCCKRESPRLDQSVSTRARRPTLASRAREDRATELRFATCLRSARAPCFLRVDPTSGAK